MSIYDLLFFIKTQVINRLGRIIQDNLQVQLIESIKCLFSQEDTSLAASLKTGPIHAQLSVHIQATGISFV